MPSNENANLLWYIYLNSHVFFFHELSDSGKARPIDIGSYEEQNRPEIDNTIDSHDQKGVGGKELHFNHAWFFWSFENLLSRFALICDICGTILNNSSQCTISFSPPPPTPRPLGVMEIEIMMYVCPVCKA